MNAREAALLRFVGKLGSSVSHLRTRALRRFPRERDARQCTEFLREGLKVTVAVAHAFGAKFEPVVVVFALRVDGLDAGNGGHSEKRRKIGRDDPRLAF